MNLGIQRKDWLKFKCCVVANITSFNARSFSTTFTFSTPVSLYLYNPIMIRITMQYGIMTANRAGQRT
jgi:hypothetical protein